MDLNIQNWKDFKLSSIMTITNGKGITDDEIAENTGTLPAIQGGESDNGILGYIDEAYCKENKYPIINENCLTVARVGTAGFVSFHDRCVIGDKAKALTFIDKSIASVAKYMFMCSVLNQNRYKYSYGRGLVTDVYMSEILKLPIQHNSDGTPVIDADKTYSDEGYVPDWQFMEDYIKSLHSEPITTTRGAAESPSLGVDKWKEFNLSDVCHIDFGNKFDNDKMTHDEPSVNFVGRTADNNGVRDFVDKIDGVEPYQAGSITVALGGSIGSCFVQAKPFYTSQNVAVLSFNEKVSNKAKLFFANIFMYEVSGKFVAFGRELNKHMKTDFTMYLPVYCDANGSPVTDSNDKYIPDWDFMERYIDSLPYSDRIA